MSALPLYENLASKIDIVRRKMMRRIVGGQGCQTKTGSLLCEGWEKVAGALHEWPVKIWSTRIAHTRWDLARRQGYPVELQHATRISYANRWWSLLSVGLQKIVNSTLLRSRGHDLRNAGDAWHPPVMDVLDFSRPSDS